MQRKREGAEAKHSEETMRADLETPRKEREEEIKRRSKQEKRNCIHERYEARWKTTHVILSARFPGRF